MNKYEQTKLEIFERCERGELSTDEKDLLIERVNDTYMEAVDLSKITSAISKHPEKVAMAASAAIGAIAIIVGIVQKKQTEKGYEHDAELKGIKTDAEKLKKEIESYKSVIDGLRANYIDKAEDYNTIAKTTGRPTIVTTDVTRIPIHHGDKVEYKVIKKDVERQNINYNPVKAKHAEKLALEMNKIADDYAVTSKKLYECIVEVRKLKLKADKVARKNKKMNEESKTVKKAQLHAGLSNAALKYKSITK